MSPGGGNRKPLQRCPENPSKHEKAKRHGTGRRAPLGRGPVCSGEEQRAVVNSAGRKKQPGRSGSDAAVEVSRGRRTVRCCEEQHCIGTWNVRSVDQGNLDVVKQEMARLNMSILGISGLRWMGRGKFNSDDQYIYCCGQESLTGKGVALSQQESEMQLLLFSH